MGESASRSGEIEGGERYLQVCLPKRRGGDKEVSMKRWGVKPIKRRRPSKGDGRSQSYSNERGKLPFHREKHGWGEGEKKRSPFTQPKYDLTKTKRGKSLNKKG